MRIKEEIKAGIIFGRLTTIEISFFKNGVAYWLCKCICDNEKVIRIHDLMSGKTKSCGCFRREKTILKNIKNKTHGLTRKDGKRTKIYDIWLGMKQRCNNPNNKAYKNYGGRGIKVCKRWMKFENFYKDVGNPPPGKSLDRINNNKGYFPNNWRWATLLQQHGNTRNNHILEYNNKKQCVSALAKEYDIPRSTLLYRINNGLTVEEAINKGTK